MELIGTLRRHWILTTSLLLLTLVGSAAALFVLPWTYQSQSTVVLLPSAIISRPFGGNPYMAMTSTVTLAADVLRHDMASPRVASDLAARGYPASYLVSQAYDTSGPILLVTTTGKNETTVQHTLYGVTDEMGTELNRLQVGIKPEDKIGDTVIAISPQPARLVSKKAKPLLVAFGLGLALTIGIPIIVDAQRTRHRPRKEDNNIVYPKRADQPAERAAYGPNEAYSPREPLYPRAGTPKDDELRQAPRQIDEVGGGFESERPAKVPPIRPSGRFR